MICNYVMVTLRYEGKALVHNCRISEHEVLLVAYDFTQKKNSMQYFDLKERGSVTSVSIMEIEK